MHAMRALAVLATRRISHVTHPVIQAIQRRQTFNLQQYINRWFGCQFRYCCAADMMNGR